MKGRELSMDYKQIISTLVVTLVLGAYSRLAASRYRFLEHRKVDLVGTAPPDDNTAPPDDSSARDYLHFVQITDTHITHRGQRLDDRGLFNLTDTINSLKPAFLVHTGDVTDGVSKDGFVIDEDDFRAYQSFKDGLTCPVYTLRGNHDTFGASEARNNEILARYFGGERNYSRVLQSGNFKYLCLFVDPTLKTGPRRLFNFFGHFEDRAFAAQVRALKEHTAFHQIILFVHYPSNTLCTADQETLQSSVRICGHLHNALFWRHICRVRRDGTLETVLEDFKKSRKFRICTLDRGHFSFNDFVDDWTPQVVIMSPSMTRPGPCSFVRFLAFSYDTVAVEVDGKALTHVKRSGIFHSARLPAAYSQITVTATNRHGTTTHTVPLYNFFSGFATFFSFEHAVTAFFLVYIAVFCAHAPRIPAHIPAARILLLAVLPNALLRPFNESFEFLYSQKLGHLRVYDTVAIFGLSVLCVETLFVLALANRAYIVPYNLMSLLFAVLFYVHVGACLRLEDVFLVAANCYFAVELRRRKRMQQRLK